MGKYFDKTFFKLLRRFVLILVASLGVIIVANVFLA